MSLKVALLTGRDLDEPLRETGGDEFSVCPVPSTILVESVEVKFVVLESTGYPHGRVVPVLGAPLPVSISGSEVIEDESFGFIVGAEGRNGAIASVFVGQCLSPL